MLIIANNASKTSTQKTSHRWLEGNAELLKPRKTCWNKRKMFDLLHLYGSIGVTGARCKSSSSLNPANLSERFHISQHCGGPRETYGWWSVALKPANGQPKLCGWFEPHSPLHTFSISGGKLGFLSVWSTIFWLYGVENRIQFLFNTSSLTNHQMPVTKSAGIKELWQLYFRASFKTFGVGWFAEFIRLWKSALKH